MPVTGTPGWAQIHNDKARARKLIPQSIPNGVPTKILLDTEFYDPGGNFDAVVNNRFDVPTSGYYLITGTVHFASNVLGERMVMIYVNGVEESRGDRQDAHGIDGVNVVTVLNLPAGQWVELWCFQTSGVALDTEYPPIMAVHRVSL